MGCAYYERALARLHNTWIGAGNQGERFRDPHHVFADDLDLFGRGSLFELLSTARTRMGERVLAGWLLTPGEPSEVAARQESVKELRPGVDLREEIALMGEDLRAALDDRRLGAWGTEPAVIFFPGARWMALLLAIAAVTSAATTLFELTNLVPFLFVVLAELIFMMATNKATAQVAHNVDTPAQELRLIALLLERLEREPFSSPGLEGLRGNLLVDGAPATRQIRRLVTFSGSARLGSQSFLPPACRRPGLDAAIRHGHRKVADPLWPASGGMGGCYRRIRSHELAGVFRLRAIRRPCSPNWRILLSAFTTLAGSLIR